MKGWMQWFMPWKPAKNIAMAVFQGAIAGVLFCIVVFSLLWITLLEVISK